MAIETCIDGNEAVALVAHRLSEVIAIYPITPASAMGELADAYSAEERTNLWGVVPEVVEMQSEAGAAGALHGAVQKGALATTFTASQGLLLMIPNLYKIAGELTPAVIHVAARTIATHALSIFGDHSDVMAARQTGCAMLCSASVQEAHDFALVAHAATLEARVPFVHFFDGFRTSHEVNRIALLDDADLRAVVDEKHVLAHRARALSPDHPVLRGSAQNPDVFFQAREACSPFHAAVPAIVQQTMDRFAARTGRTYRLVEYVGAPDAERVVVVMGSAFGTLRQTVSALVARGERVGVMAVRLYRPFPAEQLVAALPPAVKSIAVLDRTKEPGAVGEPLFQDVIAALFEHRDGAMPRVFGGRYGLSSKEFTPAMAKGVFDALARAETPRHFTVGIADDVSRSSIPYDASFQTEAPGVRALFYGLGSDGTVSATKSSVKIIGEHTPLHAQGYFVYDSRKSGTLTVSHLRFGAAPIDAPYLVTDASFVACHQFSLLARVDVLRHAARGGTFLLNSPHDAGIVWDRVPFEVQRAIIERDLSFWVIDADRLARETGMGDRINTIMQPCFFALADVLPREKAIEAIKQHIERSYGKRGADVLAQNFAAVDRAIDAMSRVAVPRDATSTLHRRAPVPSQAPDFVQRVTARMLAGDGDLLPVSALPADGTFPTATSRWEKRAIADEIPLWDESICIDCGKCAMVCPHAAIRMKAFPPDAVASAPAGFRHKPFRSKELPGLELAIQVSPDDCTGCGVCVDVCPATAKSDRAHKSLNMVPIAPHRETERASFAFFDAIADIDPARLNVDTVKESQLLHPRFEYSGACAGCGETPYLRLLSQLFGDRIVIANATGCSSIFGGNLPTTPWSVDESGRGPAWANSLFEDNAEFGLGMRLALERQIDEARMLLGLLRPRLGDVLVDELLNAKQTSEAEIAAQRERVGALRGRLDAMRDESAPVARRLASIAECLVRRSVWIVGGDGWAYDIGFGGLDHVLASGRDVNILVLDTEVYSNTGGQASKATPRGAVAKFAAGGKKTAKKDLGLIASAYDNVYVAQVAIGADDRHTLRAFLEADAWPGPSLIIAYSTCIAHGIDMCHSMTHQREAARSGYWPLFRSIPGQGKHVHEFHLDTRTHDLDPHAFEQSEGRFADHGKDPRDGHVHLLTLSEEDIEARWARYRAMAGRSGE